jgi:ubiquinone/menaquinone biosynthesis C-methylase UbiE
MARNIHFDGERVFLNKETPKHLKIEHLDRYIFAKKYVLNKKVLDIACGSGYGSFELMKGKPRSVLGGDISNESVSYAKNNYIKKGLRFLQMDGTKIPLKDNSIDLVVSFETIEHIPSFEIFLSEVHRILKKNGKFIFSSPNKTITSPYTQKPLNKFHVREFYLNELLNNLKGLFSIEEIYGQSFLKIDLKIKLKNFIRSYLPIIIPFYKKILSKEEEFDSAKNCNQIKKLGRVNKTPTYHIILCTKLKK